jgi:hypothetical protein
METKKEIKLEDVFNDEKRQAIKEFIDKQEIKYMTTHEFNKKYKDYLEEGHYGLDINIPSVIEYLDSTFDKGLVTIPGFKYSQIKLKFNMSRFYFDTDMPNSLETIISNGIEEKINKLVKEYDANRMSEALLGGYL